jgi:hypothetical protein
MTYELLRKLQSLFALFLAKYRHVHANEVLLPSRVLLATPAPVDGNSMRPGSATSGRVTVIIIKKIS